MISATLSVVDNRIVLRSSYNSELVLDIKKIPGRMYNPNDRTWSFPATSAPQVKDLAQRWGFEFPLIGVDAVPPEVRPNVSIEGDKVWIQFDYSEDKVASIHRLIPSAAFHRATKTWRCDLDALEGALRFAAIWDLTLAPGISEIADSQHQTAEALIAASNAVTADRVIDGLALPLHPYQVAGVDYIVQSRRCILGDQVGLGKTPQAIAAVKELGRFPAIVVMPLTLKLNWANEIQKFWPEATYTIVTGGAQAPIEPANFILVNYDICLKRVDDLLALNPQALLCDESHAIKNGKAKYQCPVCAQKMRSNSKRCYTCGAKFTHPERTYTVKRTAGVMKIAEVIPPEGLILLMTGTMVVNRPVELVPQLEAIGRLGSFGGPHRFAKRYAPGGTGAANLVELSQRLRSTGALVRRTKQDVYETLPELQVSVQPMRVPQDAFARYAAIEHDVVEFLANRAKEIALEAGEDPHSAYWEKRIRAEAAEHLVRITTLKEAVVDMKYQTALEWIENFLEGSDNSKIIIFGERINLIERLFKHFGPTIAVKVRGGVSLEERKAACDRFQTDPKCRIFIGNMKATSEGINLTAASNVIMLELGWTPAIHEQCIGRCYMRGGNPHGANAWYCLVPRTIEDDIYALLVQKDKIVQAVMDGVDETDRSRSVLGDLICGLARRGLTNGSA